MSFTLRTLCTGDNCRSPAAEHVLRAALGPDVRVVGAGTAALTGHGIDGRIATSLPTFRRSDKVFAACCAEIMKAADTVAAAVRRQPMDVTPNWWTLEAM